MKDEIELVIRIRSIIHGTVTMDFGRIAAGGHAGLARQLCQAARSMMVNGSPEGVPTTYRAALTFWEYIQHLKTLGRFVTDLSSVSNEILAGFPPWMDLRFPSRSVVTRCTDFARIVYLIKNRCARAPNIVHPDLRRWRFPENPYLGLRDEPIHQKGYPRDVAVRVMQAAAEEIDKILSDRWTGKDMDAVGVLVLGIAILTAFNSSTLLRLAKDAITKDPYANGCDVLRAYKGRGHKSILRAMPSKAAEPRRGLPAVSTMHGFLSEHARRLAPEALPEDRDSLFLYRKSRITHKCVAPVGCLTDRNLLACLQKFTIRHDIREADGKHVRLNPSRVRVTCANIFFREVVGNSLVDLQYFLAHSSIETASKSYLDDLDEDKDNVDRMNMAYTAMLRGRYDQQK